MRNSGRFVAAVGIVLACVSGAQADVVIDTVIVGNPGNTGDTEVMNDGTTGYGSVDYVYNIGKYEVTNSQYCEFLNAVADADPNHLYNTYMGGGGYYDSGGITRSGSSGSYTYSVRPNRGNRPANYVGWYDTLRFANWMHNSQPTGSQDTSTTEDGAYDMSLGSSVVRKPGALVFLPSEDEWYKTAYYKGSGTSAGYWDYPTQSDTAPMTETPPGTDMTNGSANYGFVDTTYYTTEVGAYTSKPSDGVYGTFDQGGNLWEWNEAVLFGSYRGLRGGSFSCIDSYLYAAYRSSNHPATEFSNIGFRVAYVPEPAMLSLLSFGGLFVSRRRR